MPQATAAAGAAALNLLAQVATGQAPTRSGLPTPAKPTLAALTEKQAPSRSSMGAGVGTDVAALCAKVLKMPPKKPSAKVCG